jgi:hypothetical protein
VAIIGTGHTAEAVLQRIRNTRTLQAVGYLDDRKEMKGRIVGGIKVLGGLGATRDILKKNRIEELIIMDSYLDRMPPGVLDDVKREGVRIRVISGPDDISEDDFTGFEEFPLEDQSVLAAGNGILLRYAKSVFHKASKLVLVSEGAVSEGGGDSMERAGREEYKYVGIMDSEDAISDILSRHGVEYAVLDFSMNFNSISNPRYAYFHEIFVPLLRMASSASGIDGLKMVVITRLPGSGDRVVADASRLAESAILGMLGNSWERLFIIRNEHEVSRHWYRKAILDATVRGGGIYNARQADADGKLDLESAENMVPYRLSGEALARIEDDLKKGRTEEAERILDEYVRRGAP